MTKVADERTGARIANYRKLRGLTQKGLAMKASVSYSTLTKIESGHSMAQPAVVAAVARALSVDVTQLTGQPYMNELREAKLEQFIQQLRIAIDAYDLAPSDDVLPRPAADIEADAARLCDDLRDGLLGQAASAIPGLLAETRAVTTAEPSNRRAWRAAFLAYDCGRYIASSWGFRDLAMLALERMGWSAARMDDPLAEAVRCYQRSLEHMRAGHYDNAEQLTRAAFAACEEAPEGIARAAVVGQAHLGAAITAARAGSGDESDDHLARAESAAQQVGEVPGLYWLSFGPTNVAVHRMSALVERNLFDRAATAASDLAIPPTWHATRIAQHYVDVARAHAWLGRHDAALVALGKARQTAPQRTRFHPVTRDTVWHLLDTKRRLPEKLASYARWVGF